MSKTKLPRELVGIMADVCRKIGMTEAYDEYRTLQVWNSVVGETIGRITVVEKIKDANLFVKVKNPSWRMELNFRKKDIITRLNKMVGHEMIRNIIFK